MHIANSTTQTGQKSIIFHSNNDNIKSENSDNKASEKDYNNYFILNDNLYTKNNVYGKVYYQNNNSNDNKYDKNNKSANQRKSYRLNNLTLIDICYNSVNNDYKTNYPKIKSNNIDNYHYYDSTQRRIEKIIPKINEYLNENSTEKNRTIVSLALLDGNFLPLYANYEIQFFIHPLINNSNPFLIQEIIICYLHARA
jgi:hypothetical protein